MAKRTSKRVSERRKTKTAVKNARKESKLRKKQLKMRKGGIRVPRSHLLTDAELEQLKSIKDATQMRNKSLVAHDDRPEYLVVIEKCLVEKHCDAFIEVLDFRDLKESRNVNSEDLLRKNGKQPYAFVNYRSNKFDVELSSVLGAMTYLEDLSVLANFRKICIFGNPKTGKFLLSKKISEINPNAEFVFVRTPVKKEGLCGVLRGYVDLKNINPLSMFEICWKFIDPEAIREYYMVGRFDSYESFLDLLAEKFSCETGKSKTHSDAALHVFKDMMSGKIGWTSVDTGIHFDFGLKN